MFAICALAQGDEDLSLLLVLKNDGTQYRGLALSTNRLDLIPEASSSARHW